MPLEVYLRIQMYNRPSILTNFVAMVLVFTMPLCCCIVKSATGEDSTCCTVVVQEESTTSCCKEIQTSCCQNLTQDEEKPSDSEPCNGDCGCIIKGTIFVQDWTPPIDHFGAESPAPFFVEHAIHAATNEVTPFANGPPRFKPHILGYSSAPPIRGTLVLEV